MLKTLLIVWLLAVVGFFVLWALLAKLFQRVTTKKDQEDVPPAEEDSASE